MNVPTIGEEALIDEVHQRLAQKYAHVSPSEVSAAVDAALMNFERSSRRLRCWSNAVPVRNWPRAGLRRQSHPSLRSPEPGVDRSIALRIEPIAPQHSHRCDQTACLLDRLAEKCAGEARSV